MGTILSSTELIASIGADKAARLTADSGAADTAVVNAAIDEAETEAESYISVRYAVPVNLSAHPGAHEVLRVQVKRLATHILHARREVIPPAVETDREVAIQWLKDLAAGKINLPTASAPASTEAVGSGAVFNYETLVSGRTNLGGL